MVEGLLMHEKLSVSPGSEIVGDFFVEKNKRAGGKADGH